MIASSGGIIRLLAMARRLVVMVMWLGIVGLVAGAVALSQLTSGGSPVLTVVLGVLFLAPSVIVLHLVLVLWLASKRFGLIAPSAWFGRVLALRWLSMGPLLQPTYWLVVGLSIAACVSLVPLALLLVLF